MLLLQLAIAGSAQAAARPPRAFFGVDPTAVPTADQFVQAARGGVGSIRFPLSWADTQPVQGSPIDWSQFDQLVVGSARQGVEVMPILYGTPRWAAPSHTTLPVANLTQRQGWTGFLQAAVRRYGPRGEFWTEHGDGTWEPVPFNPIRNWQIWNEENYFYFTAFPSPRTYASLLQLSSPAIRSLDSGAKLILGGMFGRPNASIVGGQAMFATRFLKGLYRVKGIKATFDGVALHPYTRSTRLMTREIADLRAIMRENHDARTGFYLTEFGWGSGSDTRLDKGLAGQATELTKAFRVLRRHRREWNVQGTYWFSLSEEPPNVGCAFCDTTGLFTNSFVAKPAWFAFVNAAGGQP